MNRCILIGLFCIVFLPWVGKAQYVSEIIDYKPAPGQLINTTTFGSPQAAESIIGNINGLVSLGAYGGSITIKMEEPIQNDPNNPYGIDFTIFGNAMPNWCEAGVVHIMKDENQNGMADDNWYLIAGSDYYFENTESEFQIEYFNPHDENEDILWIDLNQDSGFVYVNSIHQHAYYPSSDLFPEINQQSQHYSGLKIQGLVDQSTPGNVSSYLRGFGFADNMLRGSAPYYIPDNPYTEALENSGGDAIDISWAIDDNGHQVFLNEIHFVKITTAINNNAGFLGEISTEIAGIIDVSPNAQIIGETKCIVIEDIPRRLLVNSEVNLNAILFDKGIPAENQNLDWSSSSENIAHVYNGKIICNQIGEFTLTATSLEFPQISKSMDLFVIQPQSIEIESANHYLHIDDEAEIYVKTTDNLGFELAQMNMVFETSNEKIEIILSGDKTYIMAHEEGESWLKVKLSDYPVISDSLLIRIINEQHIPKVFVCIKTEDQTIMPRQSVSIYPSNIEDFIEPSGNQFQSNDIISENLAEVIISAFQKMNLEDEFRFKNDLDALYLWEVPIDLETSLEYIYGYGGRTVSPFERSWIVKLNDQNIVRNFQDIPVQHHDEITIYHINNVNQTWTLKEFTSLYDTVSQKGIIKVQLEQFEMEMYSGAQVYTLSQIAIPNVAVYDNEVELWYNENRVFTNSEGQAEFQLVQLGDHIISADEEEIKIHIQASTGVSGLSKTSFNMYPNPVSGSHLNIKLNDLQIETISIISLSGHLIQSINVNTEQIPITSLAPGTYILQIITEKAVYNQRFIKR